MQALGIVAVVLVILLIGLIFSVAIRGLSAVVRGLLFIIQWVLVKIALAITSGVLALGRLFRNRS